MSISKIRVGSTDHDLHASKLTTARTISLSGDVSGSASFDGSQDVTLTATVADDSHNHVISNVDGLQTALDNKLPLSGGTLTGSLILDGSLKFKNCDKNSNPTYPYTGFYQWNTEWQVNARNNSNEFVYNLLTIDNVTKNATFFANVSAVNFIENGTSLSSKYSAKGHKHSVTAAGTIGNTLITPAGTVSQPTFTGTPAEHTHTFTGTEATASVKYTPAGTVSSTLTSGAHNHTFSGTAVTSGKPDTTNVTTIYSITGVGSLPSHSYTAPSLKGSVENQCLTLTFNAGSHSFSAGSLPIREAISVPNTNHTHSVTASGTIGNTTTGGTITSTFSGTEATISHTFTPAGSISKTSITPAGTVSRPTFTGTGANHNHTFTGSAVNSATES